MSKERLAQIEAAFAEAKSVEKERICLAPYEADIEWLLATARAGLEDRERQDALQGQEGFLPGDLVEWSDENVKGMRGKVLRVENLVLVEDTDEPAARFWLDMRDWPDKLQTRLVGRGVPTRSGRADTEKA